MGTKILMIPADNKGNKLWLKDFRTDEDKLFIKYKTTFNEIPFRETGLTITDGGVNAAITSDDGTILYRFNVAWLSQLRSE